MLQQTNATKTSTTICGLKTVITWCMFTPKSSSSDHTVFEHVFRNTAEEFSTKLQEGFWSFLEYGKIGTLANKASKSCAPVRMALRSTRVFLF